MHRLPLPKVCLKKARTLRCSHVYNTTKGRVPDLMNINEKNVLLKYMCQYCFTQNNSIESHPKKDCWRANKNV